MQPLAAQLLPDLVHQRVVSYSQRKVSPGLASLRLTRKLKHSFTNQPAFSSLPDRGVFMSTKQALCITTPPPLRRPAPLMTHVLSQGVAFSIRSTNNPFRNHMN